MICDSHVSISSFAVYANDNTHVNLLMALNLTTNEGVTSYAPYAYSLRGKYKRFCLFRPSELKHI